MRFLGSSLWLPRFRADDRVPEPIGATGRTIRGPGYHVVAVISVPAFIVAALALGTSGQGWSPAGRVGPELPMASALGMHMTLAQAPTALRTAAERAVSPSFSRQELSPSDGQGELFGSSVALSGTTALVGAWLTNYQTGAAYVFTESAGVWSQQAKLTASDAEPDSNFGYSVALSGTSALIGADGVNGAMGVAYVFTESAGVWSQQAELSAPWGSDPSPYSYFGASVALSGTTAVIGAYGAYGCGAAYLFTESDGVWSQRSYEADPSGTAGDDFGISVALSGTMVLVGAPGADEGVGAAYSFSVANGGWTEQAEVPPGPGAHSFGLSVALSGTAALIGADASNNGSGAAYIYTESAYVWTEQAELTAADATPGSLFGSSVALSATEALIGAYGRSNYTGAVYLFVASHGVWPKRSEERDPAGTDGDEFGISVALSGTTGLVGATGYGPEGPNGPDGVAFIYYKTR